MRSDRLPNQCTPADPKAHGRRPSRARGCWSVRPPSLPFPPTSRGIEAVTARPLSAHVCLCPAAAGRCCQQVTRSAAKHRPVASVPSTGSSRPVKRSISPVLARAALAGKADVSRAAIGGTAQQSDVGIAKTSSEDPSGKSVAQASSKGQTTYTGNIQPGTFRTSDSRPLLRHRATGHSASVPSTLRIACLYVPFPNGDSHSLQAKLGSRKKPFL